MRAIALALCVAAIACEKDSPATVERPEALPEAARPQVPEPAPVVRKWSAACREEIDFHAVTYSGVDGIADAVIERKFDADGRGVWERWERKDAPLRTAVFGYDARGLLAREDVRVEKPERRLAWFETYEYDEAGRRTAESLDEDADGKPDWRTETDYGEHGPTAQREQIEVATGRVLLNRWYEYDDDGALTIEKVDNDGDGTVNLHIDHEYADDGRLAKKTRHWMDNDYISEVSTFDYDADGRVVAENTKLATTAYTYDSAGNLLTEERIHPSTGSVSTRTTYDYGCHTASH